MSTQALPTRALRTARPRTVTIAAALLAVQAILGLTGLALAVLLRADRSNTYAITDQFVGGPTNLSPLGVAFAVLLAGVYLGLAGFVLRGSGPARPLALAFCGLAPLWFFLGEAVRIPSVVTQRDPQWYLDYSGFASLLALAIYAAIIALLAWRPSNEYFARRPDGESATRS